MTGAKDDDGDGDNWSHKYHIPQTCSSQTHLGLPIFSLTTIKAPGYLGQWFPSFSSALWRHYPKQK